MNQDQTDKIGLFTMDFRKMPIADVVSEDMKYLVDGLVSNIDFSSWPPATTTADLFALQCALEASLSRTVLGEFEKALAVIRLRASQDLSPAHPSQGRSESVD